jgi:hypothetical protein
MIVIKLSGGLGNQMFQYAFGKHLAVKNNTDLKLDLSFYNSQNLRNYELQKFYIKERIATKSDISSFVLPENPSISNKINYNFCKFFKNNQVIIEKQFTFDSSVLEVSLSAYLEGYWQSEKYFKPIEPIIRDCFQIKISPDLDNQALLIQIAKTNSISIHIRRGDYVNVENTNRIHGTCDLNYYNDAIAFLSDKISDPVFFIFSDDIPWVKQNLMIPFDHKFVSNNIDNDHEDLRLMSNCKHNIIANSSFSWWGAWLNNNPDKIVISPHKWFNDATRKTSDLIPDQWTKL